MEISPRQKKFLVAVVIALALGILEHSWNNGFGQVSMILGFAAIITIFLVVSWPNFWWLPALGVIEEWINIVNLQQAVFNHWSTQYLGFNIYPWIILPAITLIGEYIWRWRSKK